MNIDAVDIGGASRVGVPKLPPARDADGRDDDEGELLTNPVVQNKEVPLEVQRALAPGTSVAYPEEHPARSGDLTLDSSGRLVVPKGRTVTKSLLDRPRDVSDQLGRSASEAKLNALLEAETAAKSYQPVAMSVVGVPVIEVMFQTEIGAIVGYFHKVVQQSQWLILVSDNRAPAQAKFIPQPRENPDGSHLVFDMIITGADRKSSRVKAIPLGVQFTVDNYDFIVMMMEE